MRGTLSGRSGWFLVFGASTVSLAVLAGAQDHGRRAAPNLRARTVAQQRLSPRFTDHPILGTAALSLGTYLVHEPALGRTEDGLLLLMAAERLGSRQDVPSLRRSTHHDAARERCGTEALRAARTALDAVPADQVVGLVLDVLRRGPWEA